MTDSTIRRLWMLPAILLVSICAIAGSRGVAGIYERYFNPTPFLAYDYDGRDGLATDKYEYHPGDVIALRIIRCLRTASTLRNLIFLSEDTEPRGRSLPTLESYAPAGCSDRVANVAAIPTDTPTGIYRITGAQTVTTPYGASTITWYSTPFYVEAN